MESDTERVTFEQDDEGRKAHSLIKRYRKCSEAQMRLCQEQLTSFTQGLAGRAGGRSREPAVGCGWPLATGKRRVKGLDTCDEERAFGKVIRPWHRTLRGGDVQSK